MSIQSFSFRMPSLPKIICSIPAILIALFFIRPLGVVLLIARFFIYGSYRYYRVPCVILVVALACLIPRGYELLQENFGDMIPVVQPLVDLRSMPLYQNLTDFGISTTIISVIMIILAKIFSKIGNFISGILSATSLFGRAIQEDRRIQEEQAKKKEEKRLAEEKRKEEMERIKEEARSKREGELEAEQTVPHVIKCPNCGHSNKAIGTVTKCQYCNKHIEWTPPKKQ